MTMSLFVLGASNALSSPCRCVKVLEEPGRNRPGKTIDHRQGTDTEIRGKLEQQGDKQKPNGDTIRTSAQVV